MFEALLTSTALALGLAIGFVIAWARSGKTREELAALQARAEEQEKAAADKLALVAGTRTALAEQFKALSAEALDRMLGGGGELVTFVLGRDAPADLSDLLTSHLAHAWPFVDVRTYHGGQPHYPLLLVAQ